MQTVPLSLDLLDQPLIAIRQDMDPVRFQELVDDVRTHGLEQPIIVTPVNGRYRVVAGWRRTLACRQAGLLEVPCVVKALDEAGELETMLRENLHREDPNPVEEGALFATMHEGLHLTVSGIAIAVGKSVSYVAARMAIAHGPEDVREALRAGEISLSVARELLRLENDQDRDYLLHHAKSGGATSDTVRRWVSERLMARAADAAAQTPSGAPPAVPEYQPIMGTCEWHKGQVPVDGTLSFRVCGDCYRFLTQVRDKMADQAPPPEGGETDVPRA
jgi:ParB/RepB/Spo0J family partition protein